MMGQGTALLSVHVYIKRILVVSVVLNVLNESHMQGVQTTQSGEPLQYLG